MGFIEIVATYALNGNPSVAMYVKYSPSFHATMCSSISFPSENVINLTAPTFFFFLERYTVFSTSTNHDDNPTILLIFFHTLSFDALILIIFGSAANWWDIPWIRGLVSDPDTMALVVVILVFCVIIWFVTKDNNRDKGKWMREFGQHLQDVGGRKE